MTFLDSPFDRCPVCKEYVLLDQSQRECAAEHHCDRRQSCPLGRYFTGIEYSSSESPAPGAKKTGAASR